MSSPEFRTLEQERSHCVAHHCPACGIAEHVTAERIIEGTRSVTRCHCRACGHSWHAQEDTEVF
jgi:hypothetical protein